MCRDLEAVRDALAVGADVERSVCRRRTRDGGGEAVCAFHAVCGTQRQKRRMADVWFVPHELLFTRKPPALGALAALVVDEAPWADGLEGVGSRPDELTLDTLDGDVAVPGAREGPETERLRFVHRRARRALDAQPNGPLRRHAMLAAGLTEETGRDGRRLSWGRVAEPGIVPGMDAAERRRAVAAAAGNRTVIRLARFFGALETLLGDSGPEASGWVSLAVAKTENGPVRVLRLRGRRALAEGWRVPTLLIDALLDPALVRPYWPDLEVAAEIAARTPHMRVRQLTGRDWAKTALVPDAFCDAAETERRLKNSKWSSPAVLREVRATAGRVLSSARWRSRRTGGNSGPCPTTWTSRTTTRSPAATSGVPAPAGRAWQNHRRRKHPGPAWRRRAHGRGADRPRRRRPPPGPLRAPRGVGPPGGRHRRRGRGRPAPGPGGRGDPVADLRGRGRPDHWPRPRGEPHRRRTPWTCWC